MKSCVDKGNAKDQDWWITEIVFPTSSLRLSLYKHHYDHEAMLKTISENNIYRGAKGSPKRRVAMSKVS